jgi:hypothetical protein
MTKDKIPTACREGQMAIMDSNIFRDKTIILNNDKGQNSPRLRGVRGVKFIIKIVGYKIIKAI